MKKFILQLLMLFFTTFAFSQVSISTDNSAPDPSAMLDVKSSTKGILLPRVALTAKNVAYPVVSPAIGLMVYNTANAGNIPNQVFEGYYHWDGLSWIPVSAAKGVNAGDMQYWNGTQWVRVPVGQPGQYLRLSNQSIPTWDGSTYATVVTLPVTDITENSAKSGGTISSDGGASVSARGVCWNNAGNPTVDDAKTTDGTGTGNFISTITGLIPGIQYYLRAYATNATGTNYGNEIVFTTLTVPTVTTGSIVSATQTTALGGGNVTSDGGTQVILRGVCWSNNPNPTVNMDTTIDGGGTGVFTSNLAGLNANTTYYVRAYATNSIGTAYGNEFTFSTLPLPVLPAVTTSPVVNITNLSANSGGDVLSDGYAPVTARGVCWSLQPNPTINDFTTTDSSGTGLFTSAMLNLQSDTEYSVRAYATNIAGTGYGSSITFQTLPDAAPPCPGIPTVTYGGVTYNTVQIDGRCWFRENLNIGTRINGNLPQTDNETIQKYCLHDLEANCSIYGGLYQWDELTNYVNLSGGQGICPQGWHVPGFDEYSAMITYLGGTALAGSKLKEAGTLHWLTPNTGANNRSGYTALPGAFRSVGGTFIDAGTEANFWTSTQHPSGFAALLLTYNSAEGNLLFYANNSLGYSARCLQDTCTSYSSVGVTLSPSASQVCAGAAVTITATPVNGGTQPFYQWKVNGNKTGSNTAVFSYTPANNDVVTCLLYSSNSCTANPAFSTPLSMVVNQNLPVSATISVSGNPVCSGTTVTLTATAVNGGTNPAFQWRKGATDISGATNSGYSYIPIHGDVITCKVTSSAPCTTGNPATSNSITMSVTQNLPVSVTVSSSANNICSGTAVTFTATPVNGGSLPAYQWKKGGLNISGATNATYSYAPLNGDAISCLLTSNATCITGNPATSNTVTTTVNALLPVSISISASANNVCAGTQVNFTSTPVNGGTSPSYQWKKGGTNISGATNSTYSYIPANGDVISCALTSNGTCISGNPATSNSINMVVNNLLPVSIAISVSANNICSGAIVTFTATPTNGGTAPTYQWQKGGVPIAGATNNTYTYAPAHGDVINCTLASNATCASGNPANSNSITMAVNSINAVSVSISASANPVCAGTSVVFTATPVNGGTTPSYQWKLNNADISGATNATYTFAPSNGNNIGCVITSSISCPSGNPATSNTITMTVNPTSAVSVSIVASANPVCAGTSVTYTSTPVNGGTAPSYQWRVNGSNISGATNATYTNTPANGNLITCVLTSNLACPSGSPATSNTITMTVNPLLPVSVSVAASANPSCTGNSVTFTATPVNGGTSPAYQWRLNGSSIAGATNSTYATVPANNAAISCTLTSSATCKSGSPATSNTITMTVNPLVTVSVSIGASANPVCAGTAVTYTATPINGGSSPQYQWIVNSSNVTGATNATYSFTPTNGNTIKCNLISSLACPSPNPAVSNTLTMTVNPQSPVSIVITATSYAVMPNTSITFTAVPTNGGTNPSYQWKKNSVNITGATNSTYTYSTPANNDNFSCVLTSNATSCVSNNPATSNVLNLIVYSSGTACTTGATVVYGGMTYNTVQIGAQCWLRENLNIGKRIGADTNQLNNGIVEKYCYNNSESYCNTYGGLYQWAELVQYLNGASNTAHWSPAPTGNVKGLCPDGWHIPSNTELTTFYTFLGGTGVAGGKMKELGTVHWSTPNTSAGNTYGFTCLPGGYAYLGAFGQIQTYGNFWTTSTGAAGTDVYWFGAAYNVSGRLSGQSYKVTGYSVRCLKD